MSRRRNRGGGNQQRQQKPQNAGQLYLRITIQMTPEGRIEVDPTFNRAAIENLDRLYAKAERDDYDKNWEDDHKIAFFQLQVFDEILSQYESPATPDSELNPTPGVPSLREAPIREVVDIATMTPANATPLN